MAPQKASARSGSTFVRKRLARLIIDELDIDMLETALYAQARARWGAMQPGARPRRAQTLVLVFFYCCETHTIHPPFETFLPCGGSFLQRI